MIDALPTESLRRRCFEIQAAIAADPSAYRQFVGKRLQRDRGIISVPIDRHWRMMFRELSGKLELKRILSHSDYNHYATGKKTI